MLVYTSRSHASGTFSSYVVHEDSCPHAKRSRTSTNFGRIRNLHIKVAVGSVRPCTYCEPDMAPISFPKDPPCPS